MNPAISNGLTIALLCCGVVNLVFNSLVNCHTNLTRVIKGLSMLASCFAVFYAILKLIKFF